MSVSSSRSAPPLLTASLAMAVALGPACGRGDGAFLTATVERGPIEATVSATGTLNPVHMVEVGTYASGRIESVYVDYNSRVSKGQRIAKIDPAISLVRVQKAEANMLSARARVERAEADLRLKAEQLGRQRALYQQTMVSEDQYRSAETAHAQAKAELAIERASRAQSEAELEDARVNLRHTDIVSPVDGVVLSRNVNVGQTVAATFQTPTLFLIARDLTDMQVNADVSESDIGRVKTGQSAHFVVDAYPERLFQGRVSQVRNSPISVQNVVTYDVVIAAANADLALRPGMTATVTLTTDSKQDVLKVPLRALRFRPRDGPLPPAAPRTIATSGRLWLSNGDGQPVPIGIQTGLRDDEFVEVISDEVSEGDAVIVGYARPR